MPADPFVYLNGSIVRKSEASLSIEDRGALFADGVYEVTRYYGGRPFGLDAHVARMKRSLAGIRLPVEGEVDRLVDATEELVRRNRQVEAKAYWQITRGAYPRDHLHPKHVEPTVLAIVYPAAPLDPHAEVGEWSAVLTEDVRWSLCWIKSLMLLGNTLAHNAARDAGADAAILHRGDRVTEGASTNVFAVRQGVLFTHPADQWILDGITRRVVLELAHEMRLPVREVALTVDELRHADEVFVTGTTTHLAAVTRLDNSPVGGGRPGPLTQALWRAFVDRVRRECLKPSTTNPA